ncbi:hypothetical protein [Jeotgalibacillus sp. R-1-5s-1]|nr:hypothetical protein [Jeotgalibacillus sp. R-1-5s-1]
MGQLFGHIWFELGHFRVALGHLHTKLGHFRENLRVDFDIEGLG